MKNEDNTTTAEKQAAIPSPGDLRDWFAEGSTLLGAKRAMDEMDERLKEAGIR